MIASGFSWFHLIPAVDHDQLLAGLGVHGHTYVFLHTWLACLILLVFGGIARLQLDAARARPDLSKWYADERLSARNFAEMLVSGLRYFMDDLLDKKDVRAFLPLIGSFFLYIWVCNLFSLVPGLLPPTDYVNTNVGIAAVSFLTFLAVGLSRDPVGFIKHLWGPVWWLGVLLFPIEVISLFIRPTALVLRLTGNMFGDHLVFTIMSDMVPIFVPVAFLALATMVSTIQAFVFSLLSVIYIHLSVPHHDHDEAHGPNDAHAH